VARGKGKEGGRGEEVGREGEFDYTNKSERLRKVSNNLKAKKSKI
jgi:hypothetical protein